MGPELIKLGIQDPYRKSLITLGNAEEIIGKDAVNKLTVKPMPTPKIAPLSDRREALSFDSEGEVFDIIETES